MGVLTALTVLTGCSTMPGAAPDPREQLAQRPTFEAAERGYLDLLAELKRILDERVPGLEWQSEGPAERSRGGCGEPFDRVDGAENANYSVGRGAMGAVPDAQWQPTVDALRVPLGEQGFTQVTVLQDEPGAHEVSIGDPHTGARVVFGTKVGTILTLYGACFLREDRG
ncbi:LppA family lipoprotein [Phycicoccus avicenniae]|uniref:LppA family lipoprotein n=1 Tax=Phycicoccus avicenniae TaxID=2828860 RepID=UPI003D28A8EA